MRYEAARQDLLRGDYIVLISALILLLLLYSLFWGQGLFSHRAVVLVNGKPWRYVDVYQDQHIHVPGSIGDSELEVADGKIRFVASPCSTKQCIHQGWLSTGGETAACVPNRVSIHMLSPDPRFDSINF